MRDFVYGDDVVLEAYKENAYIPFACVEEVAIAMQSEIMPTSVPDSGAWADFTYAGKNSWTAQLNGVLVLKDAVNALWFGWEMFLLQVRSTPLNIRMRWKDRQGIEKYCTGKVLIPDSGISGKSGDISRYSIRFQGTGPLDLNGALVPPVITNMNKVRIDWIATGAEPNILQHNDLIGITAAQLMEVSWEGDDKFQIITSGEPNDKQVRLDNAAGTIRFKNNFFSGDYIRAEIAVPAV